MAKQRKGKAAKRAAGKKAAAKKPAAKAKKSAAKAKAKAKAKPTKKAAKKPTKKPAKKAPAVKAKKPSLPDVGMLIGDFVGRAMIVHILGDAEAYFFDFARLGPERRSELIEHHLAAFDRRKKAEGKGNWAETFVPVALLGESMPPPVRSRFDLSAPHEGVVLLHRPTGALVHASSRDDEQLAVLSPDLATISPAASVVDDEFDPAEQSYAYIVDRSQSAGFTRGEIETMMQVGGAHLVLV